MTSETDIVNAALRLVAGNRITSMAQGTKNANVAADLYQAVRDNILASHNWKFATLRAELSRSATAPAFEFQYAYVVPDDWMRTVSVHDNNQGFSTVEHKEGNVAGQRCLLASTEQLFLRYVGKITDPNLMPADFRMALIYMLASDLGQPVANSGSAVDRADARATRKLLAAKASDSMGSSPEQRPSGSWVSSRSSWRRRH